MAKLKKIFVLDTNVILHDFNSIYNFEENDVVIPITVLEELDKFKKGNDQINFHAREFSRELDRISGDLLFSSGVPLGLKLGKLSVETGKEFSPEMKRSFQENIPDHRILAIAEYLHNHSDNKKVILVSKDINLRMKAKSLGVPAEDYKNDQVKDLDDVISMGITTLEDFDDEKINFLYKSNEGIPEADFGFENPIKGHKYFILKNNSSSALAHFDPVEKTISRVEKPNAYGIYPRNAEQTFSFHALMDPKISLVALTGRAGTGKTLVALAAALQQIDLYDQIFLARPIVALANKDLGYLPGDAKEKIGPYMQPLFDNLSVIKHKFNIHSKENLKIDELLKEERLQITPLAYIRGRSLSNTFFIVDEAQNLTPHEIKTIITRAGEGTKMIFTGDIEQIDSPYLDKKSNGLAYLSDRMQEQDVFAHVNLIKGERSHLAELASHLL
ncbi:phosphate starvation-inducible protein PhoH [Labilibaculum filiforme]|uniref:Phosphate starvation-inducible protein PhoH n=1 Tax=Labilibaculum filiforme TaxID=1940526 RepID=A0A2N3I5H7_9BACT|nr:PhoH family protein [Labilibaculum filiforme]PKQ65559.1 phosphate starvation-inducible protein PhoH [Labilibaculum filiforme]